MNEGFIGGVDWFVANAAITPKRLAVVVSVFDDRGGNRVGEGATTVAVVALKVEMNAVHADRCWANHGDLPFIF